MEWLLEKNNFGYTLYKEKQIKKREQGPLTSYEFCVTDSTLALHLMRKYAAEIKQEIKFQTENLSIAESELANLIITSHNKGLRG